MTTATATTETPARKPLEFRKTCPECMTSFVSTRPSAMFCCTAHKQAWHNRQAERGRQIMTELMAARMMRNSGETAAKSWSYARRKLDQFIAEDRKAGRMPSVEVADLKKVWFL